MNYVYLHAQDTMTIVELNRQLSPVNIKETNIEVVYSRITRENYLITIERRTNNLMVTDVETGTVLKEHLGYGECEYRKPQN